MNEQVWDEKLTFDPDAEWQAYPQGDGYTVVGTLKVSRELYGPAEGVRRRLLAYLPPSYDHSDRHYPVVYMHDGQNLFDAGVSHSGEWQVDETMEVLSREGIEAIVVGIANAGKGRGVDYSAHCHSEYGGGGADAYIAFILNTIKPMIDGAFRTHPQRETTGLLGSSMGGSISLYGLLTRPDTFGFAGVMSPAFWWSEGTFLPFVQATPFVGGRIYMDVGDNENPETPGRKEAYLNDAIAMDALLREKGYTDDTLRFVIEEDGPHHESAWARRLPDALRFLLAPLMENQNSKNNLSHITME